MSHRHPRLALASPVSGPDSDPSASAVCLAALAGLTEHGWRVQHFRTCACLGGSRIAEQITGLPTRCLDPWLMTEEVRRDVFRQGARNADLVLVEGASEHPASERAASASPGALRPIAETLDLPKAAIIPCSRWEDFHWRGPLTAAADMDAIILDGIEDPCEYDRLSGLISAILDRPVIGAIEALPEARRALKHAERGGKLAPDALAALGDSFLRFADLPRLFAIANRSPLPHPGPGLTEWDSLAGETEFRVRPGFRVAYAHDEAFRGYYPETLDALESAGADLAEFSPLRDERLPDAVDLVLLGCGQPERYADALSANCCMASALRSFASQRGRIYAEGGGAAYLARQMRIHGKTYSGVGVFREQAVLRPQESASVPVDRALIRSSWLGGPGTQLRGYLNRRWRFVPRSHESEPFDSARAGALTAQRDLVFRHRAIGSLVHLHPAALPCLMAAFVLVAGEPSP